MEKKFQWSYMFGGKQIVIRTDDQVEFDKLIEKYEKIVNDKVSPPMDTPEQIQNNFVADYEAGSKRCKVHNAVMIDGKSKKPPYKPYSYHDGNNGEGRCFGKDYLPPRA